MKRIWVLLGPSGSGKTTLLRKLNEWGIPELVSHTTRTKRDHEKDGQDYWFVDKQAFEDQPFVEFTEYSGNLYGLSVAEVERKLMVNDTVAIICDKKGVEQLRKAYPNYVKVIYVYVEELVAYSRMTQRGTSTKEALDRLNHAKETGEFYNHHLADYLIVNQGPVQQSIAALWMIVNGAWELCSVKS